MSGHSKWSQIKRKKGAADVKRGAEFGKLAKAITIAARVGKNLDMAIAAAKAANMPKDNIERAVQRGTGESKDGITIEEITYEAYGPGGAALLIIAHTDNRNRTVNELRAAANKFGLTLAQPGSVLYLFDIKGMIEMAAGSDPEQSQLALIDAGVDDLELEGDRLLAYCAPHELMAVRAKAESVGLPLLDARIGYVPKALHRVDEAASSQLIRALEALEELDDVSTVETNADL